MGDQPRIASLRLVGVFGHQQLMADFHPGLNLLHGKNGSGKTTILHVLANLLEGDLYRFCSIRFARLIVRLHDGTEIVLEQTAKNEPAVVRVTLGGEDLGTFSRGTPVPDPISSRIRELFPNRPVYLPAFRSILEAADEREQYLVYHESIGAHPEFEEIKSNEERYAKERRSRSAGKLLDNPNATASKTILSRRWFGEFVPIIRYPSVADVSRQLKDEFEQAYFSVNRKNQETFSTVFSEVLQVLEKRVPQSGEEVRALLNRVQEQLRSLAPRSLRSERSREEAVPSIDLAGSMTSDEQGSIRAILTLYDAALEARATREQEAYRGLRLLEDSFNRFIEPKALRVVTPNARRRPGPTIIFTNKRYSADLGVLSSGERQVLTMLFCATHMSPADGTMLIDEPEISLHVDWQRIILDEIMRQAGDRQIIVCTHAPEVVAEHRGALVELSSKPWSSGQVRGAETDNETELTSGD